ncbi:MAG TPA: UDP-3-O-(3-hydroxymyristoyl)glucosamine N-acyltransferase [Candidatus Kapabacteria bacterium]|nr:UDP-3-O-(3-hydroxymyristoyl)glucosamine N-acyltransferase [Candidatus Kapabacteria bacterium]
MINFSISQIAELLGGTIVGETNSKINGLNGIELAKEGDLSFYYSDKYEKYLPECKATCLLVPNSLIKLPNPNQVYIKLDAPYKSLVRLLKFIESQNSDKKVGAHHSVIIGDSCIIDNSVYLAENVVVGNDCKIGAYTKIYSNSVIADDVVIGRNTIIYPNVTIYKNTKIGDNCILQAGSVIGSDGFGYLENPEDASYDRIPQLGNVELEDNVEIGANSTIDCALMGTTIIRKGTKIDNLVHIAHNCDIGQNSGIAAQVGISGSVKIGNRARLGGQTGIAGHLEICDDVTILAQSGVSKTINKSGVYFGSPIRDVKKAFRIEAVINQLPEVLEDINSLKKSIQK